MAEQQINYPKSLDEFGQRLRKEIQELSKDTLKPANMRDIVTLLDRTYGTQQMLTLLYNLMVVNFEVLSKRVETIETRTAGYSERLNALEHSLKGLLNDKKD